MEECIFFFNLCMESLKMTECTTPGLDKFKPVPKILSESFRRLISDGNVSLLPKAMSLLRGKQSTSVRSLSCLHRTPRGIGGFFKGKCRITMSESMQIALKVR